MSLSSNLFRLQQIDSQTHSARVRLTEIEKFLSEDETLNQAQQQTSLAEAAAAEASRGLRAAENAVQDQRIKIELTDASLYGGKVRNPKELQDLQHEAASLRKFLAILEDRQIEAMIAAEESESRAQAARAAQQSVENQLAGQQALLLGEKSTLEKQLERLEIERQAALGVILAADLSLYETLRQQRRGVAVAKVSNRCCAACGATLTPATIQSASSPAQLVRCTSCGRILYVGA